MFPGLWVLHVLKTASCNSRNFSLYFEHKETAPVSETAKNRAQFWKHPWGNGWVSLLNSDPLSFVKETRKEFEADIFVLQWHHPVPWGFQKSYEPSVYSSVFIPVKSS